MQMINLHVLDNYYVIFLCKTEPNYINDPTLQPKQSIANTVKSFEQRVRKLVSGFLTRSNTNQAVQPQKMDRCLKSHEIEGLHCL